MQAPIQAKPMTRAFMQEIVGRHWVPDAEQRTAPDELPAPGNSKNKRRKKPSLGGMCLRQLTTFAVRRRG